MIGDGEMVAERAGVAPDGKPWWRWSYTTVSGANYIGARLRKSKQSALRDGRIWLDQQKNS